MRTVIIKIVLTGLLILIAIQGLQSQTIVNVGGDRAYSTLKQVFDAINSGLITGQITITINGNVTETSSAILNASGTGGASYSSITMYPTVTGLSISGNFNSNLIDFNGADNVTIDGRVNAAGTTADLTIVNSNTGTSSSTFRFINSATGNTIRYCKVKGSSTGTSRGIIFFSTSSSGNGNDNNIFDNNEITSNSGNRVINGIFSLGSAGRENSSITISSNKFYDLWRVTATCNSIFLSSYTTECTISGNSIYETTSIVPTSGNTYAGIKISNSSAGNMIITDNYIGGQEPLCGGSALNVSSSTAHLFQGISLTLGNTTASSVQNNTIKNFNYASSHSSIWMGIYVSGGSVNIGTTTGNQIGESTGTGSITVTGSSANCVVQGINFAGNGTINVSNNIIGSITAGNSNSAYSTSIYGINRTNTVTTVISNNLIGSTSTSHSLQAISLSTSYDQSILGIRNTTGGNTTISGNTIANLTNYTENSNSGTLGIVNGILSNYGITTITNNTIYNLRNTNRSTSSSSSASVTGIAVASTNALNTISGNTIYGLSNTNTSFAGTVTGLYFGSTGMYTYTSHTVTGNFIHSLSVSSSSTTASIYGIKINTGQTTYANNIISIGGNTATSIYGIYEYGTENNHNSIYFNTVYLSGSLNAGVTNKSYALFSNATTNVKNFRNNIFVNARSTTSGSNLHYAAYFNYSTSTFLSLNYNDYYVSGTGGVLGYYASTNKTSLPIVTGKDTNSLILNPVFNSAGGTLPENYYSSATLPGVTGTIITTDFAGITRGATPKMGAYETSTNTYTWQGNTSTDYGTASNWLNGAVPPDGSNIEFAISPANNCILDQNRTIHNITNSQSTYKLIVNGHQLILTGNLTLSGGAQIDASTSSSVIIFSGTSSQSIPSGAFTGNTIDGMTINNSSGVTLNNSMTVQQGFTLTSGAFSIGANTLTLNGAITRTSGTLTGGSSSVISIGGSGAATLPAVVLSSLTLNRSTGLTLAGDMNISGTLTLTLGTVTVGANSLSIGGVSKTTGNIDASNTSASVVFGNSSPITLPVGLFTGSINNLSLTGSGGITASEDLTVNGTLNLQGSNPTSSKGILDMDSDTLDMGESSVTTGTGDVTGVVRRAHTFATNTTYTFGSQFTKFTFVDNYTKPLWIICKIRIGSVPGWSGWSATGKVKRIYNVAASNNSSNSQAEIDMRYLISELDATDTIESRLVFWHKFSRFGSGTPHEHGKSTQDLLNHSIGVTGIVFGSHVTTNPDSSEVGIAYSLTAKNIWKGEVAGYETDWNQTQNWTKGTVPISSDEVLIPGGLNYYPSLSGNIEILSLEMESGATLTANSHNITIRGSEGAWINHGTFIAGTSKVMFNFGSTSQIVTVAGETDFYNIECGENTLMQPVAGCMLRIAGNGTAFASSIVDFSTIENTVEYNGADQTIVNPPGINGNSGYYNLIFSGSGIKTMPVTAMNVNGDLTIGGTASVTCGNTITIGRHLTIGDSSTFATGNFNHSIGGNFENNGTFTTAAGYKITMVSDTGRFISGVTQISFKDLDVNNPQGVTIFGNVSIANTLNLLSGNLYLGGIRNSVNGKLKPAEKNGKEMKKESGDGYLDETTITISGNMTLSENTKIDAKSTTSTIEFSGTSEQTIPDGAFTDNTVNNIKINNTAGVTMGSDLSVNGTLTLTAGLLNTGTKTITFGADATNPVETSSSRIVGTAMIQDVAVGTGSFSFLGCNIAEGTDDLGHIKLVRKTGTVGIVTVGANSSIQCNWDIIPDYEPTSGRTVEYRWFPELDNGKIFTTSNKAINYCSTDDGVTWTVHGEPVDVSASNPRVMTFTTTHFSKWVSTDQNGPLPVSLSSLTSTVNGRNIKLNWTTLFETNNSGFDIERKPMNGVWSKVGFIQGKGTVNSPSSYSFEDRFLNTGKYSYRLKQIDFNGNFEYHLLGNEVEVGVPTNYALSQNYPNPFNPTTKINYELPFESMVSIIIYDMLGKEVKTLVNEKMSAGYYTVQLDASGFSSGVYFYRIVAKSGKKDFIETKKMVMLK